jgi:ketosteroid isomerase-like protein
VPDENVETIRRWINAVNNLDFDAAIELVHPAVVFLPPGGQPPYRGAQRLRRWMEPEAFLRQVVEVLDTVIVNDHKVLGKQHVSARGRSSGIEMDVISWSVWTFDEDGLISRIEIYLDQDEAREAAGLSE